MRGVERDVTQPGSDCVDVDAGTEEMDGRRVANCVRTDVFADHRRYRLGGQPCIVRDETVYPEPSQRLVCPTQETASFAARPITKRDSKTVVAGHRGHIRILFPLPRMWTDGEDLPSCRSPIVSFAASSARAPLLYKKSKRKWSRAPSTVR